MYDISQIVRKNILSLVPYSSARDEYSGQDAMLMDANENPFNDPLNRYPDPRQRELKQKLSLVKKVSPSRIFLGNGSDEAIDLLVRCFCDPGRDNIVSIKPTYGMYKVCADINNVEFREVLLKRDYQMDLFSMLDNVDRNTKLMFICSPNNPTSNNFAREDIVMLLKNFRGLMILDEAYADFSSEPSFLEELDAWPNLVILQTFSKAWGLAGIRLGMAFADEQVIAVMNRVKYPYNINWLTQQRALEQLEKQGEKDQWVKNIIAERNRLSGELERLSGVRRILPSDSNFLMVRFADPKKVFTGLQSKHIIVRDRSSVPLCEGFLRITVGSPEENDKLLDALKKMNLD